MRAFAAMYRPYNDIDIYVEDRSLVGLYERVFSRMLEGVAKISSVTPLDGRIKVLEEAERLKNDNSRKRFFLVDGDFFWILGPVPIIRDVYMLKCYSFENLAFERTPILGAAYIMAPERSTAEIDAMLSVEFFDQICSALLPLFKTYAIAAQLGATCETVGFSVQRLTRDNSYILDSREIRTRIRDVIGQLRKNANWAEIIEARRHVERALAANNISGGRIISGKSYLLAVIMKWFQKEAGFRGNMRQLMSLIFESSNLSNIDIDLRHKLVNSAR